MGEGSAGEITMYSPQNIKTPSYSLYTRDYEKLNFATNLSTMVLTALALFAAITYYFSLTKLEVKYYLFTYVILLIIILFIFSYVLMPSKEVKP